MNDPELYEAAKSAAKRDSEMFTTRMVQDVTWTDNEIILDYGCGAGSIGNKFLLPQAEKYNSILHSVDISSEMITFAKINYPNPRVTFDVGDILHDNFIHKDKKEAIRRFYEILKPGGYFTFTVLTKSTVFLLHKRFGESEKFGKYMQGIENFIPEWFEQNQDAEMTFRKSLTETGFEILQLQSHRQEYTFPDLETYAGLYTALNPFMNVVPKDLHEEWKNECKSYFRNLDTTNLKAKYKLLYGIARKPF